jgi:phosphate transport system substrate-binding protein
MKIAAIGLLCAAATAYPSVTVAGAGSTFVAPIATEWCRHFQASHPGIQLTYQSVGSGEGIRQAIEGSVDFGATDGPMNKVELESYKSQRQTEVIHLPVVIGAVVPAYNLPGNPTLNFTPEALAGIYLGTITKWNAPELTKANPGIALPDSKIVVVHRSDGSGTSYVWADYLAKVSTQWKLTVGVGTSVVWPVGIGGKGNDGVADVVVKTPSSIGYLELGYAVRKHLCYGTVKNASGKFVKADSQSVAAAADSKPMPEDFRVSITNSPGVNSYPIASFSWFLVPRDIKDPNKHEALIDFIRWVLTDGQAEAEGLLYVPLPPGVRWAALARLKQIH